MGSTRRHLALVGVIAMLVMAPLAGCSALTGRTTSLSQAHVELTQDVGPAVVFNYSVNSYTTALLEGPNGDILGKHELSPDASRAGILMGSPQAGKYTLVLRQDGETTTETSLSYDGPKPALAAVDAHWSQNRLKNVSATITNHGDLPLRIGNASYTARGTTVDESYIYQWIPANSTETITLSQRFGASIAVTQAGEIRGEVDVETSQRTLTGDFKEEFAGAQLTITNTTASWEGNNLEHVDVTVRNTGDLPADANASVRYAGKDLVGSLSRTVAAGGTATFELDTLGSIFVADSGGSVSLDVVVSSDTGYVTDTLTHEVAGASISLESMTPAWRDGDLTGVTYQASNDGAVEGEFTATVAVNGETVRTTSVYLAGGKTATREVGNPGGYYDSLYSATSGGSHEVTLTLSGNGATETASSTKTFAGGQGDIRAIDTMFLENYGSDTLSLSSVDFSARNTGDLPISYDSVEVSIGDVSTTVSMFSTTEVAAGGSQTEYLSTDLSATPGSHELTIRLLNSGEVVLETTTTVSASS